MNRVIDGVRRDTRTLELRAKVARLLELRQEVIGQLKRLLGGASG